MKRALVAAALLSCLQFGWGGQNMESSGTIVAKTQPNIVMIIADDWADTNNDYYADLDTPNIDRIAAGGVNFTNAFSTAACAPSRTMMLMGMNSESSGLNASTLGQFDFRAFSAEMVERKSIFQHLSDGGYDIHGIGKIFHHTQDDEADDSHLGVNPDNGTTWDSFQLRIGDATRGDNGPARFSSTGVPTNGANGLIGRFASTGYEFVQGEDWGIFEANEPTFDRTSTHPDSERAAAAITLIETASSAANPLMVAVGFFRPHAPHICPHVYIDAIADPVTSVPILTNDQDDVGSPMYNTDFDEALRDIGVTDGEDYLNEQQRAYIGCLEFIDSRVGLILDAVEAEATASGEEFFVIFLGDHGYSLGERGYHTKFQLSARATRTTFMMMGVGLHKGAVVDEAVNLVDLFGTISDMALLARPTPPSGLSAYETKSLVPLTQGYNPATRVIRLDYKDTDSIVYTAYRTRRWAYIVNDTNSFTEFYDMALDPNEQTNLDANGASTNPIHVAAKAYMLANLPTYAEFAGSSMGGFPYTFPFALN